ncbi:putative membrane protein [Bartonella australis AUST/NH1]|uniref:Putative membrane protein n=2 Tax=Bartonella australis TaxID=388640 RepID=M1NRK9_BARAA|nr:copper chaperone PCu(A)C [Bartonella australis]AGF73963.1 putative membrane protein [Bartonella australis AUST/NH1]
MELIAKKIKNFTVAHINDANFRVKKVIIKALCVLTLTFMALPATANQYTLGDLEIIRPWIRETPRGAKVASGYLYIINHANTPDRLISVSTDGVQEAEIHSMAVTNDTMRMAKMPNGIEIPGNGEITLKPGGNHIMFIGLSQPFRAGDKISVKLIFEKAGAMDVDFYVNAMDAKPSSELTPSR